VVLHARRARLLRQAPAGTAWWLATSADAEAALQASLTATGMGVRAQEQRRLTVAAYLEAWLEREKDPDRFRPSTALHTGHHYWIPLLGHYRLADLTVDVDRALASLRRQDTRTRQLSASSVRRIHATLRSVLKVGRGSQRNSAPSWTTPPATDWASCSRCWR
jgi:hypothetical protein